MLVLSREIDEVIMIGDGIEITVVDIRGGKVRLGITAPEEVPVHRKEVWEEIQTNEILDEAERAREAKNEGGDAPDLPSSPLLQQGLPLTRQKVA